MTINPSDIVLLESERMADYTDGGGRRTSRVIPDGVPGNIFPKVSRLDAVYGRVNLRKVYGAVLTANLDTYAGAHAVITDPPDNDRINCLLFSTRSEYDARAAARDRIESYVIAGPESRMIFYGRQLVGQMAVLAYQRAEDPLPEIGEVFSLRNDSTGAEQYVRITDVDHEIRGFIDDRGTYNWRVLSIKIGSALLYEFSGPEAPSRYSNPVRTSKIRSTTVADAARYYGILPLQEPALANALTVKAPTIYSQIVPTTQRETAVSLAQVNGARSYAAAGAARTYVTDRWAGSSDVGRAYFLPRAVLPGALTIVSTGTAYTLKDDRRGNVVVATDSTAAFGANSSGRVVGSIDYASGGITPSLSWPGSSHSVTAIPGVEVTQPAHTKRIAITLGTRGTVYAEALVPLPAPGTLLVDYRALGKWYRLRDDGAGKLSGDDPAHGVGSVDYVTGAVVITLGALPDVESALLLSWGSPVHYTVRAGASADADTLVRQELTLPDTPVLGHTLTLTYTAGGVDYEATCTAAGVISGGGLTGTLEPATGKVRLTYTTRLPDTGTGLRTAYQFLAPPNGGPATTLSGTVVFAESMSLASGVDPGTVVLSVPVVGSYVAFNTGHAVPVEGQVVVKDNGSGVLLVAGDQRVVSPQALVVGIPGGQAIGSIDYATGAVVWTNPIQTTARHFSAYTGWALQQITLTVQYGNDGAYGFKTGASGVATANSKEFSAAAAPLRTTLTRTVTETAVPGSALFTLGGKTYFDRNGTLYADLDAATGAAMTAGAIDYATGDVSITLFAGGASPAIAVQALTTVYGTWTATSMFFRTGGSPIRPASMYVQVTSADGILLVGTSNQNGVISGAKMRGLVVQEMGVAALEFGEMVTAAGNELEPWYDPANVVGAQVWQPLEVLPATLRYSCVVLSNLPLDSSILGLDPVRLPSDGRVPLFRAGDVAVIHHLDVTVLPTSLTPGATYPLGRAALAEVWVLDATAKRVPPQRYSANLDAGTFTIAADWAAIAEGFAEPLTVKHRIEDLVLLSDVQLNGHLSLTAALSRDYPLGSYVSSALLFGDMNARVTNVFDLATFASFSDTPGPGATAQYNNIDYPIEVLNEGAQGERWRLNFTGTTAFQVIGENMGVIGTGTTGTDCAPINQLTGKPYFVVRKEGWGMGWAAGNQLRFNTVGASSPIWIARTVLPGATLEGDSFTMQMRGDVDL